MMHAPPRMVHTHPILPLGVLSLKRLRSRANKREQKNQNDSNWQENHTENDNGSDEDDDDLDDYLDHCGDISYPLMRLLEMKEHPNYVVMKERGYALSNAELLTLIYYCDNHTSCRKVKQYHRLLLRECKWGILYYHLAHAVDKLHQCFHLNNECRIRMLFHGSRCEQLDVYKRSDLCETLYLNLIIKTTP
eukprot:131056_1